MTPEEIAREVENEIDYGPAPTESHRNEQLLHNRAVIAKAIAAERERCAKIAETNEGGTKECCGGHVCNCPGIAIAAKIRSENR